MWIEAESAKKGNAPTAALVQERLHRSCEESVHTDKTNGASNKAKVTTTWVQRFRQKWGFTRGRFHARDRIPVAELRERSSIVCLVIRTVTSIAAARCASDFMVARNQLGVAQVNSNPVQVCFAALSLQTIALSIFSASRHCPGC